MELNIKLKEENPIVIILINKFILSYYNDFRNYEYFIRC